MVYIIKDQSFKSKDSSKLSLYYLQERRKEKELELLCDSLKPGNRSTGENNNNNRESFIYRKEAKRG